MGKPDRWVVFELDTRRYAVPLAAVEQVVRAAAVTPVPQAPKLLLGLLNLHGRILPVLSLRRRFGLPERALRLDDRFIVARAGAITVVLVVDSVSGVLAAGDHGIIAAGSIFAGLEAEGTLPDPQGLVLLYDLAQLLPAGDAQALEAVALAVPTVAEARP